MDGLPPLIVRLLVACATVTVSLALLGRPSLFERRTDRLFGWGMMAGGMVGIFAAEWSVLQSLGYALWLCGLSLPLSRGAAGRSPLADATKGVMLATMVLAVLELVPSLWELLNAFSMRLTSWTNGAVGGAVLGGSASGLMGAVLLLALHAGAGKPPRRAGRGISIGLVILFFLHAFGQGFVTDWVMRDVLKGTYLTVGAFVIAWRTLWFAARPVRDLRTGWSAHRPARVAATLSLAAVAGLLLSGLPMLWKSGPEKEEMRVLLLDHRMLATWQTPADEPLGEAFSGAVFGLFPRYLDAYGYATKISESFTPETLDQTDVVVVINPGRPFSEGEKGWIRDFVRRGGGLLAMGDHTDVGGVMQHLNGLLEPYGIGLRFDSADPIGGGWEGCLDIGYPYELRYTEREIPVSIGASLWMAPSPWVYPTLVGRRAYSDPGDPENAESAYLGNLRYDRGEPYGDLVLAAHRSWGDGKVVVFGDTSVFQNTALAWSHRYVISLFEWLVSGPPRWAELLRFLVGLALIGGLALLLRYGGRFGEWTAALGMAVFALSVLLGSFGVDAAIEAPPLSGEGIGYVDLRHGNVIGLAPLDNRGVDGLLVNLARNGYLPTIVCQEMRYERGDNVWITISPTERLSPREFEALLDFADSGGTVFLSTSWPYAGAVAAPLESLGLRIRNVPVGAIEGAPVDGIPGPQFRSAWPLEISEAWSPLASVELGGEDFVVVAGAAYGRGRLIVASDASFLLTGNLEGRRFYSEGNVAFLNRILRSEAE